MIEQGEVVVCEGYTDVIGTFQAGVPWAVATCGTALAEEHFTLLRNFAKRIVLAYDADAAGQSATSRVYEWERKHEVDVVVADLPGGSDPGELARTDPTELARAIKEARPFLQFRVDRMLQAGDLRTPEGRARAAEAALTAVAEHPDDLVRDQYVMRLSDLCQIDTAKLRERSGVPPGPSAGGEADAAHPWVPGRAAARRTTPRTTANSLRLMATRAAPTWPRRSDLGRARGAQVGRAPTRRCSGSCACRFVHRPLATAGVCRALGERQRP